MNKTELKTTLYEAAASYSKFISETNFIYAPHLKKEYLEFAAGFNGAVKTLFQNNSYKTAKALEELHEAALKIFYELYFPDDTDINALNNKMSAIEILKIADISGFLLMKDFYNTGCDFNGSLKFIKRAVYFSVILLPHCYNSSTNNEFFADFEQNFINTAAVSE